MFAITNSWEVLKYLFCISKFQLKKTKSLAKDNLQWKDVDVNYIKSKVSVLVDEIVDINVYINGLETSNADLMLDSTFNSVQDLKAYAVHPAHVDVANRIVRPHTSQRSCLDFEI